MPIIKHNIYDKEAKEKIKSILVPELRKEGFTGSYPHFRRPNKDGGFDILSFQFDKCGGSFLIEISAAYPYREEFTNCCLNSSTDTEEEIKKSTMATPTSDEESEIAGTNGSIIATEMLIIP